MTFSAASSAEFTRGRTDMRHILWTLFLAVLLALSAAGEASSQATFSDRCVGAQRHSVPVSQAASTKLMPGAAGKRFYVCFVFLGSSDAEGLSIVEGTGTTCGTNTAAIIGGATAANGNALAANTQIFLGNGGSTIAASLTPGTDLCLLQTGTGRVAGVITVVFY